MRDEDIVRSDYRRREARRMITDRDITTTWSPRPRPGDDFSRDSPQRPISVEPDKDIEEALPAHGPHQVRRLPVVENAALVGIVAQADVALKEGGRRRWLVEAISEPSEGAHGSDARYSERVRCRLPLLEALPMSFARSFALRPPAPEV